MATGGAGCAEAVDPSPSFVSVRGFRGQNAETIFPTQRLFDFPKCFDTTVKVVSHFMTKKVT